MDLNNIGRKAQEFLKTEKGEQVSDKVLDGGAAVANKLTGNKHSDKIQNARKTADERLGRNGGTESRDGTPKAP
jgi:hypothetical protein